MVEFPDARSSLTAASREQVVVVHQFPSSEARSRRGDIDELCGLARSAGADVCAVLESVRRVPNPATYLGSGKVRELADVVGQCGATLTVVNHAVTPVQERNLERQAGCRVIDRTRLILDIFAQRATTREGKLQVELAQLKHLSTRLVRGWTHLERQKGGIGLRGPGETQLETDRRLIGNRMRVLSRRLEQVRAQRGLRRRARARVPVPTVSLVGYTNAGKSSLFNRLTDAGVLAADQLFATLDPTMRQLHVPGFGAVVLSDTVGFIRDLPHSLVEAFRSTLEEVSGSSLLLIIVDAADDEREAHLRQVREVLAEIGASAIPHLLVINKIDLTGRQPGVAVGGDDVLRVAVSARTGAGMDDLLAAMASLLGRDHELRVLRVPCGCGKLRARVYELAEVESEHTGDNGDSVLRIRISRVDRARLEREAGFDSRFWLESRDRSGAMALG